MQLKVEFEYNEENGVKTLKSNYGGDYTPEEREKLIMEILDTFMPCGPSNPHAYSLGREWDNYKYNMEKHNG
jgi:hypothetical protein